MKAIVLTCDRYRAVAEHMILKYKELWPDHPFVFRIPYQELGGRATSSIEYVKTPSNIRETVLQLIADLDDDEWIYWCVDDKYPIQLVLEKIRQFMTDLSHWDDISGLLFCRCKALLRLPDETLYPKEWRNSFGDIYLERTAWNQIWIHQFLKIKVLRHLFTHMPKEIGSAKQMDHLKDDVTKLPAHRLFVTKDNFAVFGESTHKGTINQNCYESIIKARIELPKWFRRPNGKYVINGKL
jgi:hypothetical protein